MTYPQLLQTAKARYATATEGMTNPTEKSQVARDVACQLLQNRETLRIVMIESGKSIESAEDEQIWRNTWMSEWFAEQIEGEGVSECP